MKEEELKDKLNKKEKKIESKENKKEKKEIHKENKEIESLKKEIESLKKEVQEEKEKVLRNTAELMNFKRRKEDEYSNMIKYANEDLILELLPIIDNFERAIRLDDNDLSDEVSQFLSGFKMMFGSMNSLLKKYDVQEIDALGLEFDPTVHQAVLMESDPEKPGGVILEVLQKGYKYKDKVIRPAMVKVNE